MKLYFTRQEITHGRDKQHPLSAEQEQNLDELIKALSKVRAAYGQALVCSSGYRPASINQSIGGAKKSAHMDCQAADILDEDGYFTNWCLNHLDFLKECGIMGIESPLYTMIVNSDHERISGWLHLQTRPVSSGSMVFIPYAGPAKLIVRD